MNDYQLLEAAHAAIQDGRLEDAIDIIETIRENHPDAPWNKETKP